MMRYCATRHFGEARKKDPRIAAMIERDEHQQAALQARFKWREEEENRLRLDPSAQPRTVPVFFAMSLEELRQIIPEPEPAPAMTPEQAMGIGMVDRWKRRQRRSLNGIACPVSNRWGCPSPKLCAMLKRYLPRP